MRAARVGGLREYRSWRWLSGPADQGPRCAAALACLGRWPSQAPNPTAHNWCARSSSLSPGRKAVVARYLGRDVLSCPLPERVSIEQVVECIVAEYVVGVAGRHL